MVTGDHPKTAAAIARQVAILSPDQKLPTDLIMAAKDFDACSDSQVSTPLSLPSSLPFLVASSLPAVLLPTRHRDPHLPVHLSTLPVSPYPPSPLPAFSFFPLAGRLQVPASGGGSLLPRHQGEAHRRAAQEGAGGGDDRYGGRQREREGGRERGNREYLARENAGEKGRDDFTFR